MRPLVDCRPSLFLGEYPDPVRVPGKPDGRPFRQARARGADIGGEGAAACRLDGVSRQLAEEDDVAHDAADETGLAVGADIFGPDDAADPYARRTAGSRT